MSQVFVRQKMAAVLDNLTSVTRVLISQDSMQHLVHRSVHVQKWGFEGVVQLENDRSSYSASRTAVEKVAPIPEIDHLSHSICQQETPFLEIGHLGVNQLVRS